MNSKIALVLAIILGAFAAITVKFYIQKVEKQVEEKSTPRKILVAKTTLKAGQLISANDLGEVPIPNELYDNHNMYASEDSTSLVNTQIYYDVEKGAALMRSHFSEQGNSGGINVADTVPTAMVKLDKLERAVTLKVDTLTGVAMLLQPGDFVDVYWTGQTSPEVSTFMNLKSDPNQTMEKVTCLLLSDVQIMALDNRYSMTPTVAKNRIMNVKENYGTITVVCKNYEEAKMLIHAQASGKLTMTKRSADTTVIENDGAVDVLEMLKLSRKANTTREKLKQLQRTK